jgi:hypothetical protein
MDTEKPTVPDTAAPAAAPARKYSFADYAFQFITITSGVLIALFVNGLVQWDGDRRLVREARATIAQELAANRDEVKAVLDGKATRLANLDNALTLANELLATQTTGVRAMNLSFGLADLSTAGWDSAARTGALTLMDYADVQAYSRVYALQALFAEQRAKSMEQLTAALAILSDGDPTKARPDDLARFRERLLLMKASATIEEQLGTRLIEGYGRLLAP